MSTQTNKTIHQTHSTLHTAQRKHNPKARMSTTPRNKCKPRNRLRKRKPSSRKPHRRQNPHHSNPWLNMLPQNHSHPNDEYDSDTSTYTASSDNESSSRTDAHEKNPHSDSTNISHTSQQDAPSLRARPINTTRPIHANQPSKPIPPAIPHRKHQTQAHPLPHHHKPSPSSPALPPSPRDAQTLHSNTLTKDTNLQLLPSELGSPEASCSVWPVASYEAVVHNQYRKTFFVRG